ncbi:MAG: FecR domain-containing protein [Rhizomicrobium sp.]
MSGNRGYAPDLTPVEREALAWVERMVAGVPSHGDLSALARWRGQSRDHEDAFASAVRMYKLIDAHAVPEGDAFVPTLLERKSTRRGLIAGGAAVGIGLYAVGTSSLGLWPSLAELASDYRTTTGERRRIALAQGISLELNTRSSVSLRRGSAQPGIELVAGEIIVSADLASAQRFSVFAAGSRFTTRRGTFDVRSDARGTCVTCVEGSVRIEGPAGQLAIGPRQQTWKSGNRFLPPAAVDPTVVTAWQNGQLIFHDATLSVVIAELNRYRPGEIVIVNSRLADSRFSGEFSIARLDEALTQIAKVADAAATRLPGGIVILS